MNREHIRLAANRPVAVRIESTNTKEVKSQVNDGLQYRYDATRLQDNAAAFLYCDVDAHLAIRRANVSAGDEIEIVKTMRMGVPQFGVTILGDATEPYEPQTARLVAPAPPRQALPPRTNGATALARQLSPQITEGNATYWNRDNQNPAPQPAQQPQIINQVHPLEQLMTRCLEIGYRANWNAYTKLKAEGVEIDAPIWEDVRCTGTALFIERNKQAAR